VLYPQLMLALAAYLRRELVRLERVSDAAILGAGEGACAGDGRAVLGFGRVRDVARKVGAELGGF